MTVTKDPKKEFQEKFGVEMPDYGIEIAMVRAVVIQALRIIATKLHAVVTAIDELTQPYDRTADEDLPTADQALKDLERFRELAKARADASAEWDDVIRIMKAVGLKVPSYSAIVTLRESSSSTPRPMIQLTARTG